MKNRNVNENSELEANLIYRNQILIRTKISNAILPMDINATIIETKNNSTVLELYCY